MHAWRYLRFFRDLVGPGRDLDAGQVEELGLLAVKIAQMYAVRADLIGFRKSRRLRRFFERAEPIARGEIERRLEEVAPAALRERLREWDREPAAVASVGQVHRGTLDDGSKVALKIVKRDVREEFKRQVASLRRVLRMAVWCYPKLDRVADPLGVLAAVEASTLRELDLTREIRGLETLRGLRDEAVEKLPALRMLDFPRVYPELSNADLLVSEWRPEPSLNQLIERDEFGYDDVLNLFRIHGYFLFLRGVFHGDLHPGNVLMGDGRFVFLDNANVEVVSSRLAGAILGILTALGDDDLDAATESILATSTVPVDPSGGQRLRREMETLYAGFAGKPVAEASLTRQMMETVKMAVDCGVEFERDAFPVIKSLMTLDGIVGEVAPDVVLLRDTKRFGEEMLRQWRGGSGERAAKSGIPVPDRAHL